MFAPAYPFSPAIADSTGFNMRRQAPTLPQSIRLASIQIFLEGMVSPELKITETIPLNLENDGDTLVVSDDIFLVYGEGNTLPEAVMDYVSSLSEFYDLVESGAERNEHDIPQFSRLRSYLQKITK